MKLDVVNNTKRNLIFGVLNRVIVLICPFLTRAIIQYYLGEAYLGLGSLFSAILTVLSLSELGISSAIIYNMYKPVAENDTETVCALLNFYRKVYAVIGAVILGIGLLLIPFLPRLISGGYPDTINLTALYLIYLGNTVISYFLFGYMSSLIVVYQREDVNSITNLIVTLVLNALQILALVLFQNYYLYSLLMPVFTVVNNLRIAYIARKMFPQYTCRGTVSKELVADIKVRVTGAFINKVCLVSRNALDSICISAFLGLALTAIYNNYYYILMGISSIMAMVGTSIQGGIGNHVALKRKEENYQELKKLDFLYKWITTWCAVCLLCLFQPFMELWMGHGMMLPMPAVALLSLYFYLLEMSGIRNIYSSACGLWWHHRYRSVAEAVCNVVLNIVLGKFFGIYGIILATIITIVCLDFFWGNHIIFKHYFGVEKESGYLRGQLEYFAVMVLLCGITYLLCGWLSVENLYGTMAIRMAVCVSVPNAIWLALFHKREEFAYLFTVLNSFRKKR